LLSDVEITYRTKNNRPVSDSYEDDRVEMSPEFKAALVAIGVIGLTVCAATITALLYYRKHKLIVASQPKMMMLIMVGCLLAFARVINATAEITSATCTAGLWLAHSAFVIIFCTLTIKTWRVHKLLNASLKRVRFTEMDALRILFTIFLAFCVYMAFFTWFGEPHVSSMSSVEHNLKTKLMQCSMTYPEFHTVLFVWEALLLIAGSYLAYKVRDAPDAINEAKYIAMAVGIITVICSLVFPIVFLIGLTPANKQLIASMSIGIAGIAVMSIIFVPKILLAHHTAPELDIWGKRSGATSSVQVQSSYAPTRSNVGNAVINPEGSVDANNVVCCTAPSNAAVLVGDEETGVKNGGEEVVAVSSGTTRKMEKLVSFDD
jgi:hypothetical protein